MTLSKPLLLIGGPADGQRIAVSANARIHNTSEFGLPDNEDGVHDDEQRHRIGASPVAISTYAIQAIQGAGHDVFSVGVMDLSVCIPLALVAGYRKLKAHDSDMNVAAQMVTLLGGDSDGQRRLIADHIEKCVGLAEGDVYTVISMACKDGVKVRVGVLNKFVDPLPLLIAGYRFGEAK